MTSAETVDVGWLLFCAALVLLMQAGFTALESGLVRSKSSINVAIKNFANFLVAASLFWLFGFGLMFGSGDGGVVGTTSFFYDSDSAFLTAFFLFQLGFIGTATTLMSGAVAERMRFGGYLILATFVAAVTYQRRRDRFPSVGCRPLEDVAREWTTEAGNGKRRSLRRLLARRVD